MRSRLSPYLPFLFSVLAFLSVLLPPLGHSLLLIVSFIAVVSIFFVEDRKNIFWAVPFLTTVLVWIVARSAYEIDPVIWFKGTRQACTHSFYGCVGFIDTLIFSLGDMRSALSEFLTLTTTSALLGLFITRPEFILRYRIGLVYASVISLCFIIAQIVSPAARSLFQQDAFWHSTQRLSGTFTDPNAFGIVSFLLIGILLSEGAVSRGLKRYMLYGLGGGWFFVGLFSGSRTALIGVLVALSVLAYRYSRKGCAWVVLCSGIFVFALNTSVVVNYLSSSSIHLSENFSRIVTSLQWDHFSEAIFSRKIFWNACMRMWLGSPLIGIGFGRFESVFPDTLKQMGVSIDGWIDNPNSFYFGILAELGVVGLITLVLSFYSLRFKENTTHRETISLAWTMGFLIQLVFGSHLDFPEVALVFPALAAPALTWNLKGQRPIGRYMLGVTLSMLFALAFLSVRGSSRGSYGIENNGFWIARRARIPFECDVNGRGVLTLQAPLAPLSSVPLSVTINTQIGQSDSLVMANSDKIERSYTCPEDPRVPQRYLPMMIDIECSRYWIPAEVGIGNDRRPLCLKLVW